MANRAARKEQARREREELLRRQARRRQARVVGLALLVTLAVAGFIVIGIVAATRPKLLPGIQTGPAPWPAEESHLRERLTKLGLPVLRAEAFAFHIHQHLDVFVA